MRNIQFERKSNKKVLLVPLLVIVLLYITIPIVLINKGSKQLENAKKTINNDDVYSPPIEFYNGMAFLQTASSFPGFSMWANDVLKSAKEHIIKQKDNKLKLLVLKSTNTQYSDLKNINITTRQKDSKYVISIESQDSSKREIELQDSLLNKIESTYCKEWNKFFEKTKSDKSQIHTLCKN